MASYPLVSVGIPTYNRPEGLKKTLSNITSQTYTNLEIIVSDNCSSNPEVIKVIKSFQEKDKRITFYQQKKNIGAIANFKFVLEKSSGEYFMWAADDDIRSSDFLEEAVVLLNRNCDCVAATSKDCMSGESNVRDFSVTGDKYNRLKLFIENCWDSHGLFYSLARHDLIKDFDFKDFEAFGGDWIYDVYLLSKGSICRTKGGLTTFTKGGISLSNQRFSKFRNRNIHWLIPLHDFSLFFIKTLDSLPFKKKLLLVTSIIKLNANVFVMQLKHEIYIRVKKSTDKL